jgi:hypothetical protein
LANEDFLGLDPQARVLAYKRLIIGNGDRESSQFGFNPELAILSFVRRMMANDRDVAESVLNQALLATLRPVEVQQDVLERVIGYGLGFLPGRDDGMFVSEVGWPCVCESFVKV